MTEGNGEVLEQVRGKIEKALESKRLSNIDRTMLEVQQLMVMYLTNDHPRVMAMWRTYRVFFWAAMVMGAAFLTLLASGRAGFWVK